MAGYRLFRDPKPLREALVPERLLAMLLAAGRPLLLSLPPGVGKSFALLGLVISRLWKPHFSRVIWFVPTRKLQAELARELAGQGLVVRTYPSHLDMACQPNPELNSHVERGLGQWASISICGPCPGRDRCPYPRRTRPEFARDADVILAPATLLSLDDLRVTTWAPTQPPPLVIIDDATEDKTRFIRTFNRRDVENEADAALQVRPGVLDDGQAEGRSDLADLHLWLSGIAMNPGGEHRPIPDWRSMTWRLQRAGERIPGYRHALPTIVDWALEPLWQEGQMYAVHRPPELPASTIIAGAFLSPALLSWAYNVPDIADPLSGWVVQHPGTTIVNISSPLGAVKYWPGNKASIANLAADLILDAVARGQTTVLLCRKNANGERGTAWTSQAVLAVRDALRRRGAVHIRLLDPGEPLPATPSPSVIPHVCYGAIGTNDLIGYQNLITVQSFHVPSEVLRDLLFGHLPPSQRPALSIERHRRIRCLGEMDATTRRRAPELLRRLELEPVLQAAARVRFTIEPRRIVLMVQHPIGRFLGPVHRVTTLDAARKALGLPTTVHARMQAMTEAIRGYIDRGETLTHAAAALGLGEATVKRLAKAAGFSPPPGRPPKRDHSQ